MIILKKIPSKAVLAAVALMAMNIPTTSHATSLITDISTQGLSDVLNGTTLAHELTITTCPQDPKSIEELKKLIEKKKKELAYKKSLPIRYLSVDEIRMKREEIGSLEHQITSKRTEINVIKYELENELEKPNVLLERAKKRGDKLSVKEFEDKIRVIKERGAKRIKGVNDEIKALEEKIKNIQKEIDDSTSIIDLEQDITVLEACLKLLEDKERAKPATGGTTGGNGDIRK